MNSRILIYGTLSFPNLFEPKAVNPGDDPKYSCVVIVDESRTSIPDLQKLIQSVGAEKFGATLPPNLKICLKKGDTWRPDDESVKGKWVVTMAAKERPALVYNDDARTDIVDRSALYAGCVVAAHVNIYAFDVKISKGVTAGLNGIIKLADGDRLDSRPTKGDMFGDIAADNSSVTVGGEQPAPEPDAAPKADLWG